MDKRRIMGFHQPHSTILFDDLPYPNDTLQFHLIYIKRCVKDVEMITSKRLTQFMGEGGKLFKKILGVAKTPS